MRQVVITRAHNIPKKLKKYFWNKYHAFVGPSEKNGQKLLKTKNQEPDGQKKTKGIAYADKQNLSGQFFCPDIFFCPDNFFVRTIFLSVQFFCPDNFFVRTFFLSGQKGIYHQVEFCRPSSSSSRWVWPQKWHQFGGLGSRTYWKWATVLLTCNLPNFPPYSNQTGDSH